MSNATLNKNTLTNPPDNARMTISKSTITFFFGMVDMTSKSPQKERYVSHSEKMANLKYIHPFQRADYVTYVTQFKIGKEPRWVPVSNATLDKNTLTKLSPNPRSLFFLELSYYYHYYYCCCCCCC